jgi:hypothetical protein
MITPLRVVPLSTVEKKVLLNLQDGGVSTQTMKWRCIVNIHGLIKKAQKHITKECYSLQPRVLVVEMTR